MDLKYDWPERLKCKVKKNGRKYDWPQQFETSTGDKTHTGNILPRGEQTLSSPEDQERKSTKYKISTNDSENNGFTSQKCPSLKMNPTVYQAWLL